MTGKQIIIEDGQIITGEEKPPVVIGVEYWVDSKGRIRESLNIEYKRTYVMDILDEEEE